VTTAPSRPALDGIRVLELATFLAGPFAGCLLSDFGAEVIKVERPGAGDEGRRLGQTPETPPDRTPWWLTFSRNKRSVTLNLASAGGQDVLRDLVAKADVLIENFRPGTLERWGVGPNSLSEINGGLVVLRLSGYGQTGPYAPRPGFDRVAQAFSGAMFLTGEEDRPPGRAGISLVDYTSGLWGAFGVLLALRARDVNGGRGQVIDHALYESVLPFLADIPSDWVRERKIRTRSGNRHPKVAPGGCYLSGEDHWFLISATSDATYRRLMKALGLEKEAEDQRFATNHLRVENREALDDLINRAMARLSDAEIEDAFARNDVAASPVQNIQQVYEHEQVRARGDFTSIDDPILGAIPVARPTPNLVMTPGRIRTSGPAVGQHNSEIYGGLLGYTPDRIHELSSEGII
jgi:crotonobetainyl-CoA:carnitine CoA-transferase CaiB-like acyl-CoA transferase